MQMKFVHTEPSLPCAGAAFLCANFGDLRTKIRKFEHKDKVLLCNMD